MMAVLMMEMMKDEVLRVMMVLMYSNDEDCANGRGDDNDAGDVGRDDSGDEIDGCMLMV